MKIIRFGFILSLLALTGASSFAQSQQRKSEKSLLWQISGNGLEKPSYLFGTIHMLCKDDAVLSDSLISAIETTERVYLEVDMDNLFEMLGIMKNMKMKNDTTLADLLSKEDYQKVKDFIESKNPLLPFSELETYKPLLASSTLLESGLPCGTAVAMEQLIMEEAKQRKKRIEGLETMAYQLSIFDSIPYKIQAEQLLKYVTSGGDRSEADKEFYEMMDAYKKQDLEQLGAIIKKSEDGIGQYEDLLIINRNRNWVQKLKTIMHDRPVTIAVGAGHLPGKKGVIELLRNEGYTVKPVKNNITRQKII
jgi:uncharacterized protein YbaP (TraB family)